MSDLDYMQLVEAALREAGTTADDAMERLRVSEWYILAHREHLNGATPRVVGSLLRRALKELGYCG